MIGRTGISLVELTTVLLLLATVTGLAVPRFNRALALMRVRSAANRLAGDLAYVRQMAGRDGRRAHLVFIPAGDCAAPPGGVAGHVYFVLPDSVVRPEDTGTRRDAGRTCLASNQSGVVTFNSRGVLVGFNNRTLVVSQGADAVDTLVVSAVGRVLRRY